MVTSPEAASSAPTASAWTPAARRIAPRRTVMSLGVIWAAMMPLTLVGCGAADVPESAPASATGPAATNGAGSSADRRGVATTAAAPGAGTTRAPSTRLIHDFAGRRVTGRDVVVVGTLDRSDMEHVAALAERAVGNVDRVWGRSWPKPVTIVAPRTLHEASSLLDRTSAQIADTAGWAIGPRTPGRRAIQDEVVLNPRLWEQSTELGRVATLTHEITHVAVRGTTTGDAPLWFVEGFAQYLAYRDLRLPAAVLARDYLSRLHGAAPSALPSDQDFDAPGPARDDAYTASWLAVREIARGRGEPALLAAVRAANVGVSGWTPAQLTRNWQIAVTALATPTPTAGAGGSTTPGSRR